MIARPSKPKFLGPFKSFSFAISTNRERRVESRVVVYSQGSRPKVIEYLWLKFLWDELSKREFRYFILLPEVLSDDLKSAALRARLILSKKTLRNRIIQCPFLEKKLKPTRLKYQGYKRLNVEFYEFERTLPKTPKFSGWVRNSSAVGSKSPGGPSFLEPLAINEVDYVDNVIDWYHYLTVGNDIFTTL